jgi:hypothetical protein
MVVRGAGLVKMAARIHAHIVRNGHYQPKASAHPDTDPFSKEIEEFKDDDAFSTKGFEVEPATVVPFPFDKELQWPESQNATTAPTGIRTRSKTTGSD